MADNVAVTAGTGTTIAADEVSDGTLGTVKVQYVKLMDGTVDGTSKATVSSAGLKVDLGGTTANSTSIKVAQAAASVSAGTTMQNAVTANANGTSLAVTGLATAVLNIVSSVAMSGGTTVNFEASVDDTTWVSISGHKIGTELSSNTTTADGDYRLSVTGYKSVRARISGYSAGTVTIIGYASPLTISPSIMDIGQLGGTAVDTNSGNKSAGTQRVVLATDQPNLTTALNIKTDVATTVLMGKKTVTTAGTRVTLASSTAAKQVIIRALSTNTGTIYVGDSTVASTNGYTLTPGEAVGLEISNLSTVNLDASVNGEGVTYLGSV